uniref:Uncharacterized protein n=1 Tax=Pseudo-nitzschia australis TaxID=44445 RepID=A0A7S4EEC0_9STRA|eukprot:CAMPEP_0168164190 /NCGR_PEP_ID=MMETSP0139_2-20121125/798_1 /TAXON_ID=44445 /ORGANISM="Pseudo-nitzschia australis, Strain 10249 10 AB" /LENGTH=800 /DNA_ID=CAMNT_0008081177 /DNA_START=88 /DNA_END=2490 /DNA_ORIENTATION=-
MASKYEWGRVAATDCSDAGFQDQKSIRGVATASGGGAGVGRSKKNRRGLILNNTQGGEEPSATEDGRSLFSRLKCSSRSDNSDTYSDNRKSSLGDLSKFDDSQEVHKMLTPWLVIERRGNERNRKNSEKGVGLDDLNVDDSGIDPPAQKKEIPPSYLRLLVANGDLGAIQSSPVAPGPKVATAVPNSTREERTMMHNHQSCASENNSNNKINTIEAMSSVQDLLGSTGNTTKVARKKQNKNPFGSVIFGKRHRASSKSNASKASPSPKHDESNSHHLHRSFPHNQSINPPTSAAILQAKEENTTDKHHDCEHNDLRVVQETKSKGNGFRNRGIDSFVSIVHTRKLEPTRDAIYDHHGFCFSDGTNSILDTYRDGESPKMMTSSTMSTNIDIGNNNNRRNRSPSPSRLRRPPNLNDISEMQRNGKTHIQRQLASSLDHELLMGLEMHRQLDQISSSLECGTMRDKSQESSLLGSRGELPRKDTTGFSIFSSSTMSCLNPASQVDCFGINESTVQNTIVGNENNQNLLNSNTTHTMVSKPITNKFCSAASSALLLDVRDDDPHWQFLDKNKTPQQSSSLDQTSTGNRHIAKNPTNGFCSATSSALLLDVRDDDPLWQFLDKDETLQESSSWDQTSMGNGRIAKEDSTPTSHTPKMEVNDTTQYRQNYSTHEEENDAFGFDKYSKFDVSVIPNSRAYRFNREVTAQESPIQGSTTNYTQNVSGGIPLESRSRYESVVYSKETRYNHESEQPSKETLLRQMRDAVKKASAELDSRPIVKTDRYDTMTMETEACKEVSSPMSDSC